MSAPIQGHILTPAGFVRGTIDVSDGRIRSLVGEPTAEARARDEATAFVLPGFIDSHVHGGGGSDTMQGGDAIDRIARMHVRHGTTALLATTMRLEPSRCPPTSRRCTTGRPPRCVCPGRSPLRPAELRLCGLSGCSCAPRIDAAPGFPADARSVSGSVQESTTAEPMTARSVIMPARTVITFVRCDERPRLACRGRLYILLVCIRGSRSGGGGEPALASPAAGALRVIEAQEYIRHMQGYAYDIPR